MGTTIAEVNTLVCIGKKCEFKDKFLKTTETEFNVDTVYISEGGFTIFSPKSNHFAVKTGSTMYCDIDVEDGIKVISCKKNPEKNPF